MLFFIVHDVPGRVRLRARYGFSLRKAQVLADRLDAVGGIEGVRVNPRTGSVLLLYANDEAKRAAFLLLAVAASEQPSGDVAVCGENLPEPAGRPSWGPFLRYIFVRPFMPVLVRVATAVAASVPFILKGVAALCRGRLSVDVLDAAAIGISLLRRDFKTARLLTLLLGFGEALEAWTRKKSLDTLAQSLALDVDTVWVRREGREMHVAISELSEDDLVIVRTGSAIPVDGVVAEGEASVNQASMTGEPLGVLRSPGSSVYAGTVVEEGEIAIRPMNLLMLYWEPGVDDIQASPHFFSLSLADTVQLESRWPQLAGHTASVLDVPHYIHDGSLDTSDKSVVVDWYYKKLSPEGRSVLHYCKFCNGVVLYASENDPALAERGFYDHGKYPFVFDALFMEEDSPAGFGYIDVMKECQTAIDKMNHAMDENVLLSSRQRYVLSDTAGVNEEELTDLSRDIIHVVGRLNDDSFRPLQTAGLQGNSLSYRNSRIEELKEISGNRDMTQGGTAGGVTAASAIAALQEAGSKLSRDMLKSAYRAFAKECCLIIELMRQFYDEERIFRITGKSGESEFVRFSGQVLRAQPARVVGGVELGSHEPVFDIVVSAEKKSTFSRLSQNETAKECYQLGFFAPANADAALAALEMMDFEGIEKVRQRVRQNGTLAQQLAQMQAQMAQLTGLLEVQKKSEAPKLSGPAQELSTAAMARAMKTQKGEMR